jgi:DNA-binding response OmpR family regulator
MKRILIAGFRGEVNQLFELLLWQPSRQFVKATTAEQCLDLAKRTSPDLIIVDSGIADLCVCHELIVHLRMIREIEGKPLLLIAEPQKNNGEFKSLLDLVDGVLPVPFNPEEVNSTTREYL